jgi:hypothetical protein
MIMRITRGKLHPGTWSAYEQAYKATVVAKSPHIEGLRGRWLGQDLHILRPATLVVCGTVWRPYGRMSRVTSTTRRFCQPSSRSLWGTARPRTVR